MPLSLRTASKADMHVKTKHEAHEERQNKRRSRHSFVGSFDASAARTIELAQNELILRRRMRNSMHFERLGISGPSDDRGSNNNHNVNNQNYKRRSSTSSGSVSISTTASSSSPRPVPNIDQDRSATSNTTSPQSARARAATANHHTSPQPSQVNQTQPATTEYLRRSRSGTMSDGVHAASPLMASLQAFRGGGRGGARGTGRTRRASISSPTSSLLRHAENDTMFSSSAHNLLLRSSRTSDHKSGGDFEPEESTIKFLHRKMSTPGTIGEKVDGVVMRMRIYEEATSILSTLHKKTGQPLSAETVSISKRELAVLQRSLALCAEPEYTVMMNDRLELPPDEYGEEVKRYLIQEFVRPQPTNILSRPSSFLNGDAMNHSNGFVQEEDSTSDASRKSPSPASSERSSVVRELRLERSQANLKSARSEWMMSSHTHDKDSAWRTDSDIVTTGSFVAAASKDTNVSSIDSVDVSGGEDVDNSDMLVSARSLQVSPGSSEYLKRFENTNEWGDSLGGDNARWESRCKSKDGSRRRRQSQSRVRTRTNEDLFGDDPEAERSLPRRARSASSLPHHASDAARRVRLGSCFSWVEQKQSATGPKDLGLGEEWAIEVSASGEEANDVYFSNKSSRRRSSPMIGNNPSMLLSLLLQELDEWDFDIFLVEELAPIGSMHIVTFAVLERHMMLETFNMDESVLNAFLRKVQSMYPPNPYHNSIHAADVVQAVSHSLVNSGLDTYAPTALSRFALLFAAVVHDVNHPGVNNNFLIRTQQDLAILYNDISPLENMHVATAFQVLQNKEFDITQAMSKQERITFRSFVVPLVLATDNAEHSTLMKQAAKSLASGETEDPGMCALVVTKMALHAADVSSSARPWEIYQCWSRRIIAEFRQQGDRERALGLAVIPLMDRESTEPVARFQAGFVSAVVKPLYDCLQKFPRIKLQQTCDLIAVNLVRLKRVSRFTPGAGLQMSGEDHVNRARKMSGSNDSDSCFSGTNSTLTAFSESGNHFGGN